MRISIEKKTFSEAVYKVARFAEKKQATLPALASVLILAGEGTIKMRATNLETGIDLTIPGTISRDGVVAIPAHILQQIASSVSGVGLLTIDHVGDTLTVSSGGNKSVVKTTPYEDFPSIPIPEDQRNSVKVSGATLRAVIGAVGACASNSTIRPELASLFMKIEGGVLTVVATDSFRLAEKKVPLANQGVQGTFLIPAKNALEIAQALPTEEVQVVFDEHQCAFMLPDGVIVSRLTSATYPDYQQIIPKDSFAEAVVLRRDLEIALKHTAIFSDVFQKVTLTFDPTKNALGVAAKNQEIGESNEVIGAQGKGEALTLSFNHRFLSTVFSLTDADSVTLRAAGIGRPLVITGVGDNALLYLISPMNQ